MATALSQRKKKDRSPEEPNEFELNSIRNDATRLATIRITDEESLLACATYVDLNPIRVAIAETLETIEHTSVQSRSQALQHSEPSKPSPSRSVESFLSPLTIDEKHDPLGACADQTRKRCSDKGFLSMPIADYCELLDISGRMIHLDKTGYTPADVAPIRATEIRSGVLASPDQSNL